MKGQNDMRKLITQSFQRNPLHSPAIHNYFLSTYPSIHVLKILTNMLVEQYFGRFKNMKMLSPDNFILKLHLYSNTINNPGCRQLTLKTMTNLRYLNLNDNKIGDRGCKYISRSNWPNIEQILFSQNNITNEGCKYISRSNWPHLHYLSLKSNRITVMGCKFLIGSRFKSIKLYIHGNDVGTQGYLYLKNRGWNFITTL